MSLFVVVQDVCLREGNIILGIIIVITGDSRQTGPICCNYNFANFAVASDELRVLVTLRAERKKVQTGKYLQVWDSHVLRYLLACDVISG